MPRTVSVAITANTSGFTAGMGKISASAKTTASSVQAAFGKGLDGIGKNKRNIDTLSTGLGKIGIVAGLGVGLAVKSFADFDKAMSGVAATGSDARANLEGLRAAAIKAGADTKYSATEAAGGVEALAKAGVTAKDTLGGGLTGALNLAAAGNLDVAGSAESAASAMNQFGLSGQDIPHIADLLAQAAGTAQGEVSDMAAALNQSGLIANQFGLSIDETAQSLALFAKNGLVGSDAGTSFKTMLTSLYAPAGAGAAQLTKLGVSAYDAAGAIKPIGAVTDDLKAKLDQLSEGDRNKAVREIFGSDAIRAGTILLKDGSAGLAQMAGEFGKFGSAADVARQKMDNLSGDLEQLKGSFETALIGLGSSGDGPLRALTQSLTNGVNAFNDLGDGSKSAILAVGAGLAGIALSAAGVGKIAVFAAEARAALTALGISAKVAGIATAGVGAGLAVAGLAFGAYATHAAESRARVDDFTTALQGQTEAVQANVTATAAKQLLDTGAGDAARQLGLDLATVTQAALGNEDAMAKVASVTQTALDVINTPQEFDANAQKSIAAAQVLQDAVGRTGSEYNKAVQDARDFTEATSGPGAAPDASAYDAAATAMASLGSDAGQAAMSLSDLAKALFEANNAALAASNAQIGYEASVDAAAAAADKLQKANKDGANALNVNTEAGRANRTLLNNQAAASQNYVQSLVEQGKGARTIAAATRDARGAFIANATAMGVSGDRARALADKYGLIPKKVSTAVEANTGKSEANLGKVKAAIKGLPKSAQTQVTSAYKKGGIEAAKAKLAELKNKTVTATTKGNTQGATKVNQAMKNLDNRTVLAKAKGDPSGATKVKKAVGDVKGKTVKVNVDADTSGASQARNAIATVHGKTVYVRIRRTGDTDATSATGGLITHAGVMFRGPLHRSNGGPVWGAGTATSDSIPAMLSDGEFVIRAAAVKAVGIAALQEINAKGYAKGGPVGFAKGGPVTTEAAILALMAKLINPLKAVDKANADIAEAKRDKRRADTHKERVKADRELTKATKALTTAQNEVADASKQAAATLADPYRSKSHDIDDWLESMKQGAADLSGFQKQIEQLKKLGVSDTIIKQITDQGAQVGSELAQQIIDGGGDLVKSLNTANTALEQAANKVGFETTALKSHAAGGPIVGPGTGTSDSITARLSNGEYVVNARATAQNRSVLDAINYGRTVIDHKFTPTFASGGYVPRPVETKELRMGDIVFTGNQIVDIDKALRVAKMRQRDAMTMQGLRRSL